MDEEVRVNGTSSLLKYAHLVSDQTPTPEPVVAPRDKTLELLSTIVGILEDIRDDARRTTHHTPRVDRAREWLHDALEAGPDEGYDWNTLALMAEGEGIRERTLRTARDSVATWLRDGTTRKVLWRLP